MNQSLLRGPLTVSDNAVYEYTAPINQESPTLTIGIGDLDVYIIVDENGIAVDLMRRCPEDSVTAGDAIVADCAIAWDAPGCDCANSTSESEVVHA